MTSRKKNSNDDSDLADLLGNAASGDNQAAAPLNLDHLTQSKVSIAAPVSNNKSKSGYYYSNAVSQMSLLDFLSSYISMLCHYYPKLCGCFTIICLLSAMLGLANLMLNPTQELGIVHHHNIKSKYDLQLGQVDHWCLRGGNDHCACDDPLVPLSRIDHLSWVQAFKANRQVVQELSDKNDLDIAFYGESVVEVMSGRWMGQTNPERRPEMKQLTNIFQQYFDKDKGAKLNGVALGIAGDTAPNVLWRLLHGELPDTLQPKLFWISLGMNDLARTECSEEIVVLGILRVVEELLEKRPKAHVVINSIFPMASIRGDPYPVLSDFGDAFTPTIRGGGYRQLGPINNNNNWASEAERAHAIEAARDKRFRRFHPQRNRRRPYNPYLQNRHRIRRYQRPRQQTLPYWLAIRAINQELKQFCQENERVHYFDADNLFLHQEGRRFRFKSHLLTVRGHPTVEGFRVWEASMAKYATDLLEQLRTSDPGLFETKATAGWFGGGGSGSDVDSTDLWDQDDDPWADKENDEDMSEEEMEDAMFRLGKDPSGDGLSNAESNDGLSNDESNDGLSNDESEDGLSNEESEDGLSNEESEDGLSNEESEDGW